MEKDESCYCRFLNGDESGLRALMERYGNCLTLYINGYIHDLDEAEDLMIEAFSRITVKKPRFEDNGFKPYLYKTARNLALRHGKKHRLHPCFGGEDLENEIDSKQLIEDIILTEEQTSILHLSMHKICQNYREVLYLIYFEGMSYEQAATVMKKTIKQVANLVYRGKQALRPILEKEGITNENYR
ncbi:MAG: RNA polymerase sigma factor [Oscillospiraceae bacterium]